MIDGIVVCQYDVVTAEEIDRMTAGAAMKMLFKNLIKMGRLK